MKLNANLKDKTILFNDIMLVNNTGKNPKIHSTAIIEEGASIGNNVSIGAYCIIGSKVKIGDNCTIRPHVMIGGKTTIGKANKIYPFAVIGEDPQDLKYDGEESEIIIGDNNSIREHCTIHPGTKADNMLTKIGSNNLLMVNTHIAHDCIIGNNCIFANNATLAGHVHVGDYVVFGGLSAVHQFVKIGDGAMLGGMSGLGEDLIPYGMVFGDRGTLQGLNLVGLKRRGFDKDEINALRAYYKELFNTENSGSLILRSQELRKNYPNSKLVAEVADFLSSDTSRRFCTPRKNCDN